MRSEPSTPVLQVAFLTGQSDPVHCGVSPAQLAFLQALHRPGRQPVALNFPYADARAGHRPVPLPLAAWRNARQYLASRRDAFADRHRPALLRLLDRAPHTALLAGSCGLELLANLRLPADAARRISVFAFGPVARSVPDCAQLLCVRGRRDGLSRRGYRGAVEFVDTGHMDYLASPQVLERCDRFLDAVARRLGACAST